MYGTDYMDYMDDSERIQMELKLSGELAELAEQAEKEEDEK